MNERNNDECTNVERHIPLVIWSTDLTAYAFKLPVLYRNNSLRCEKVEMEISRERCLSI